MKAAIIDHSYHKTTKSSFFFHELVNKRFNIDVFWDESWSGGESADVGGINAGNYDVVFSFQIILDARLYKEMSCRSLFLVPMYDSVINMPISFWYKYYPYRFICFSKTLFVTLVGLGFEAYYLQYFPDPHAFYSIQWERKTHSAFFWYRTNAVSPSTVNKLLDRHAPVKLYLHNVPDPGFATVDSASFSCTNDVSISSWFSSKESYLNAVARCEIFIAPRLYEGIGFGFLEAMALGCCVIAPNKPTMNEYIINGENGILYNPDDPLPVGIDIDTSCLGNNARKYIMEGHRSYLEAARAFLDRLEYLNIWGARRNRPSLKMILLLSLENIKIIIKLSKRIVLKVYRRIIP